MPLQVYQISDLLRRRTDQKSFHIASEEHVRIEFMRFERGQRLGPVRYNGDVVLTCFEGEFSLAGEQERFAALCQAVLPEGQSLDLTCHSEFGVLQLIWSPPFAIADED